MKKKDAEPSAPIGFYQKRAMGLTQTPLEIFEELQEKIIDHAEGWASGLVKMRDDEIYKAKYKTFDDYCKAEWGFSGKHGRHIIRGERFRVMLLGSGELDENEERDVNRMSHSGLNKIESNGSSVDDAKGQLDSGRKRKPKPQKTKTVDADEIITPKLCTCPTCNGKGKIPEDDLSSIPD